MSRGNLKGYGVFLGISLLAVGCKVGPDFHAPRPDMPAAWVGTTTRPTTQASITNSQAAQVAVWWKGFNDPALDSLIDRAIESNLDLQLAESRIVQARAARGIATAAFWPTVDANGSFRRSRSGQLQSGKNIPTPKPQNLYQTGFDAAWELDVFGGVRRGIEAAEANIQAAIEDRRSVLVTLTSEVALNYVELRGFQEQLAIARRNLKAQQASLDVIQRRAAAGEKTTGLDVANAQALVSTTQSQIPALESAAQQAIYTLSVLLGREPGALLAELTPAGAIPPTPPVVPVGLPSDLLRRRPDIRSAEAQIHAATAQIGVATADLFPKFSLTGSAGLESATLKNFGNWDGHFYSFGPSATWRIFDAGRIFSNIRVQTAIQQQALITYQKTVLTAMQDVETALVAYEKEQQRRVAISEAVVANRRAVDIALQQYSGGRTIFLDVVTAERNLYQAEDALVQSQRTVVTNLIALYKALGGGWELEVQPAATTRPANR